MTADEYDGPEQFAEAGEAMSNWCNGAVSPIHATELLSRLARTGLIVPVDLHNETCQSYADQLTHAHTAADELVRRLSGDGSE